MAEVFFEIDKREVHYITHNDSHYIRLGRNDWMELLGGSAYWFVSDCSILEELFQVFK